jgi:hypothetical protein
MSEAEELLRPVTAFDARAFATRDQTNDADTLTRFAMRASLTWFNLISALIRIAQRAKWRVSDAGQPCAGRIGCVLLAGPSA